MSRVAIIGTAQTKYQKINPASRSEMAFEVTCKALENAGLTIKDIDNVVTHCNDYWDGRTISCIALTEVTGSDKLTTTNVPCDGTYGTLVGMTRILSGHFKITLVIAESLISETIPGIVTNALFDPIYERLLGIDAISSSALQARRYMSKYGVTEEQCAMVSVKNHKNALNNPLAHLPMNITVDDVMNSKTLAGPIKLYDSSPASDGACALILAEENTALERCRKPVWINGVGMSTDLYHLGDRDLAETKSLTEAAKRAYDMAEITNPSKEIDVAEISEAFSYMELMWMEGLGLVEKGRAGAALEAGMTQMNGSLPINPSGGLLSSHAPLVAGIARIAEATLQLREEAGDRQVDGARVALAHGTEGACGQGHCVFILGR